MRFENYTKEKLTIDMSKANVIAFGYMILFALLFGIPYLLIWGFNYQTFIHGENNFSKIFFPLFLFLFGIILHELVHGVFFAIYAKKGLKSIKFGVMWKYLAPYCHCKEPLKMKQYIVALLAPLFLVGVLPAIIGILSGNMLLTIFGIFFCGGAAGDLMIYQLIKKENPEDYVQDHPTEAGCYIFRKN